MDLEVSDELSKKPKKDKKSKKHKKVKKSKKLKKKIREVSSSSSLSDSEDSGNEWVEKGPTCQVSEDESESKKDTASFNAPQRDEWMTAPCMFACVSREQLRAVKQPTDSKKKEEAAKYMLDRPGQSSRELNPYWADNGTGLPSVRPTAHESLSLNANTVGDQGVGWLRRALKRAKEQAEESGRSLEEVAAERWGSLQKLEDLLSEAEGRKVSLREGKPNNSGYELQKYRKNDKFGSRFRSGHEGGGKDSKYERKQDRLYDRDYTQNRGNDKYTKKDLNYGSLTPKHGDNDGFRDSRKMASFERPGDAKSYQASSSATQAPCSDKHKKDAFYGYSPSSSGGKARLGFQKPGESYDKCATEERYSSTSRRHKSWQKEDKRLQQHDEKTKLSSLSVSKRDSKSPSGLSNSEIELEKIQVKTQEEPESGIRSDQQLNELAAKLVKAEILGNNELIEKLQRKLDAAREARSSNPKVVPTVSRTKKSDAEVVILSRTDSKGFTRPLQTHSAHPEPIGGRRKKQNVDTHGVDGQRVRYFPDDDKYTLQEMFQREKLTTVEDQNEMFAKLAGKDGRQEHDYDMDDIFSEKARQKESDGKVEARERGRAIQEHKRKDRVLDSCKWCFDGKELQRHLIISAGSRAFLCLPPYQSLTEGHCLIIPLHHTTCSTQLDEDVWEEMQDFRKALVRMFSADDEDCVFFESAMYLNKFPHMILHCVPLSREIGDMAPIYFKKAILECETEWSTNKKLVDLSKRNIRHSVPKGLPYFSVDFGNEGGFAHVIEEEKSFPINFAQEIIGGMLDLDHNVWRKPRMENFDKQRSKVIDFSKKWQSYDFTKEFPKVKRLRTEEPDPFDSS